MKISPEVISSIGYCREIGFWQKAHFLFCIKKLIIGIRFLALSLVLHFGHFENQKRIDLIVFRSDFSSNLLIKTDHKDQKIVHKINIITYMGFC
jgi:hypothetical protein